MTASSSCSMNNLLMCIDKGVPEAGLDVICSWSARCYACSTQSVADVSDVLCRSGQVKKTNRPRQVSLREQICQQYFEKRSALREVGANFLFRLLLLIQPALAKSAVAAERYVFSRLCWTCVCCVSRAS